MRFATLLITILALLASTNSFASYVAAPYETTKGGTGTASQTANMACFTDGSGDIQSDGTTTATELGYVHGVTSAIQTQFTGKANTTLGNLGSTAVNASIIPASAGTVNLGSAALPYGSAFADILELIGSSSGNFQMQAAAVTTPWTMTVPAGVCAANQYWADNGSGVYSCTSPSSSLTASDSVVITTGNITLVNDSATPGDSKYYGTNSGGTLGYYALPMTMLTVVNGGDTAYSIQAGDGHVRSGTTLTAARTYTNDACTSGNIGERHEVKNLPSQTFTVTVAGNGSDTIDGAANYVLNPGDSLSEICAVAGDWDIE